MTEFQLLKEALVYDQVTGVFTWIPRTGRGMHKRVGVAGSVHYLSGYRYISFNGKLVFAHRLAFLYMTGEWPSDQVDHITGERDNNAWSNLRVVNNSQNMQNISRAHGDTVTGELGVTFRRNRYEARIQVGKCRKHLGTFKSKEDAVRAYLAAKLSTHTHNERFVA